jgi:L-alanine-DL-glutamate epimerase-like enolase superfamily enzyme
MIIKNITARNINIPVNQPKYCAALKVINRPYTLVNIITDDDIEGWSYVGGSPVVKSIVEELKPMLVGEKVDIPRLWYKLVDSNAVKSTRGGFVMRAVSAIDIALWDIAGKAAGLPIHSILGHFRDSAPVYYSGGYYPLDCTSKAELLTYTEKEYVRAYERGFRSFKMKIGAGDPETDYERVVLTRKIIGLDSKLMLDANCSYSRESAVKICHSLEPYQIDWIEEPVSVDDYEGWKFIADRISIPIALGETHFTRRQFKNIIQTDVVRILQPNPTLMGGFTELLNIAAVVSLFDINLAPHVSHDLSIQLALSRKEIITMEYMDLESDVFTIHAVLQNPVLAVNGEITAPTNPGHGLVLDEKAVKKYLV